MGLQIYSGEARPAPFSCSLAPSPLSLAPPIQLFFFLLVTLFPWLFSLTLYPSALVPLLSPLGHHSSYFVPLVLAQCLGCPDSKEEVAAYPSGSLGLANGKKREQRSSFITIAINNANSSAAAAGETGERRVAGTGTGAMCTGTARPRQ